MYGFVNHALELLVIRRFGQEKWEEIKKEAGVVMEGKFIIRNIYQDDATYAIVVTASRILDVPASALLEEFGKQFFDFCKESGYTKILKVLGANTREFLQNLDALHDHLATIYPGMIAPSFRCSDDNGALILHYYSDRPGLEHIVIGIVKAVAKNLHNSEVEVKVIKSKEVSDHVQFAIIENTACPVSEDHTQNSLQLSQEPKISPATFSRAFPFHILFDRRMRVIQAGSSIVRVMPIVANDNCRVDNVLEMIRPHMEFDFHHILSHINTVYVLRTREGILGNGSDDNGNRLDQTDTSRMRLKGQMVYVEESDCLLFLCSPSVNSLDDLSRRGLYLSDIPLHDATRDLVLLSEKFDEEYRLTQRLEFLTDKLQTMHRELEAEKQKTDK